VKTRELSSCTKEQLLAELGWIATDYRDSGRRDLDPEEAKLAGEIVEELRKRGKNGTKWKSLNKLAEDPRITDIWDEDEDGIWASLAPGYNNDGCSCIHEWSVKDLLRAARDRIQKGRTY